MRYGANRECVRVQPRICLNYALQQRSILVQTA